MRNNTGNEKERKREGVLDLWNAGLLFVCLAFYLFFPFFDGPVWCKDSLSYATMSISREPLYPVFLWIFRKIFGEDGYLLPVVLVQSVIAALAAFSLAVTVGRYQSRDRDGRGGRMPAALSVLFQFAVTLLCRFVAIRGSSYIDSIMTEGLGLSLYVLFIVQLYRYLMERRVRNLAGTAVYALLLVNLRKQMMITLCIMAAAFLLYDLIKKRRIKRLLLLLALTVSILFVSKFNDRLYNHFVRDAWIEHSGNSMGVLCTMVYTADKEDASLFEDPVTRELFLEVWRQADEQQLRIAYAPRDWVGLSSHYADSYDAIGYGIVNPVVQGYIGDHFTLSPVEAMLQYDAYCGQMTRTLMGQEWDGLLRVFAANIAKGFVNSIARVHPLLNVQALLAYGIFLALYVLATLKKAGEKGKKSLSGPEPVLTFAEVTFLAVVINSLVVGVTIFAQPRYMIYNMGLFYSALSLLALEFLKDRKKNRQSPRN